VSCCPASPSSRRKFSGRNCSGARSKSANSRSWTHWIVSLRWDDAKRVQRLIAGASTLDRVIDTVQPHLIVEQAGPRYTQPKRRKCTMPNPVPLPPPGFDDLSVDEKIDYLQSLWDRITAGPDTIPVPKWHRDILDERLKDYQETPDAGDTWDVVQERLRKSLNGQH
jgi:putative addiction module component (TIGR02574 family)